MRCFKCLESLGKEGKHGLHPGCFEDWFGSVAQDEFGDLRLVSTPGAFSGRQRSWNSSFFHGNYKKYTATLAGESYILKARERRYPELPDVEFVCNQLARFLKIPVADYFMVSLFGERVFVTKNFCKTKAGKVTLNHIYKYLSEKNKFDCETLIDIIFGKTGKFQDVSTFVEMCLFDALVGNHDRHGRNIGLLVNPKGVRLAPIYDNPSNLGLESGGMLKAHWNPKGTIATRESDEPTPKDYVEEFVNLGYGEIVNDFIKRIDQNRIMKIIDEGFCTELMKSALKKLMMERIGEYHDTNPG